jgi:hypothetical protein
MKNKLQTVLKLIDKTLNEVQPNTMDELIDVVHKVEGAGNYGTSFSIVEYMGALQGVRVYVTGKSKSHPLPSATKVYSVFKGIDKYRKAGYKIEYS